MAVCLCLCRFYGKIFAEKCRVSGLGGRNGGSGEPEVQPQARSGRNDERKGRSLDTHCSLIERSDQGQAGCLAFRWSLRRRNDNLPVPLCPLGKSVDSADLSAMATVFPGAHPTASAVVDSSAAASLTLMSPITP